MRIRVSNHNSDSKMGQVPAQSIDFLRSLLMDERGQATVEYILILSLTVTGASLLVRAIIKGLDNGVLRFGAQLERDLKTGRVPASVWSE